MDYTAKDFENCFLNPFNINDKLTADNINKLLPALYVYPEFKLTCEIPLSNILKYIACLYQEETPLRKIDNIIKRKVQAAKIANFPVTKKGELTAYSQDIINGKIDNINKMIIRFCRIQRNPRFTRLVKIEEFYHREFELYEIEEDATKRSTIMKNIATLGSDMQNLINELLINDNNKLVTMSLFEAIEAEQLELSAEYMAFKFNKGEDIINFSPYGKNYKPDKLKQIPGPE